MQTSAYNTRSLIRDYEGRKCFALRLPQNALDIAELQTSESVQSSLRTTHDRSQFNLIITTAQEFIQSSSLTLHTEIYGAWARQNNLVTNYDGEKFFLTNAGERINLPAGSVKELRQLTLQQQKSWFDFVEGAQIPREMAFNAMVIVAKPLTLLSSKIQYPFGGALVAKIKALATAIELATTYFPDISDKEARTFCMGEIAADREKFLTLDVFGVYDIPFNGDYASQYISHISRSDTQS